MEHLTKQQIILLTLFTTFVTSIATGIVTVSLVDQAPVGVTGTVERVIQETVNSAASGDSSNDANSAAATNAAASATTIAPPANPLEAVASAVAIAQKSLVRIELDSSVTGLGVVVSKSGLIVTDKSTVAVLGGTYSAVFPDGNSLPVVILQSQNNGDIVFLLAQASGAASTTPAEAFVPAAFAAGTGADAPVLGEAVVAISGADTTAVSQGIIRKINADASSTPLSYVTSIDPSQTDVGSPLFDLSGGLVGIQTLSLAGDTFYPVNVLQSVIPVISVKK